MTSCKPTGASSSMRSHRSTACAGNAQISSEKGSSMYSKALGSELDSS